MEEILHHLGGLEKNPEMMEIMDELPTSSEQRKKPSYFPLYWLVNRDPYNGLL